MVYILGTLAYSVISEKRNLKKVIFLKIYTNKAIGRLLVIYLYYLIKNK